MIYVAVVLVLFLLVVVVVVVVLSCRYRCSCFFVVVVAFAEGISAVSALPTLEFGLTLRVVVAVLLLRKAKIDEDSDFCR